jgi:hypothetical protein
MRGIDWLMASAVVASDLAGGDRVYFNRPGVALVTWNPDLRAVCLESQGLHTSESQDVLDAIIRALRAHHGSRWLLDGRKMKVIKQADQDWITRNWLPRAAAAGLRLAAIVTPISAVAMTNIDDVARVSENGIDVRFVSTVEKGEALKPPSRLAAAGRPGASRRLIKRLIDSRDSKQAQAPFAVDVAWPGPTLRSRAQTPRPSRR